MSPAQSLPFLAIDEADQFTPDNWVSPSPDSIRLTGTCPLNAEPQLQKTEQYASVHGNHANEKLQGKYSVQ
ncbi:nitrate reductase [Aspergillus sclerotialis]|uniref:Nitrate reductase n=1 Tax=Aspergillus sclerotialis TaxID=2070753 RepID=A0A3A2ZV40_9EURO|nr:nitrate reductase [Aspergillus sclerotialis]